MSERHNTLTDARRLTSRGSDIGKLSNRKVICLLERLDSSCLLYR